MELNLIKQAGEGMSPMHSCGITKTLSYTDMQRTDSNGRSSKLRGVRSAKTANLDLSLDTKKRPRHRNKRTEVFVGEAFQFQPRINDFSYCEKCKKMKPPRTHHCKRCNRCILRMDHHCPWLGNCIGFSNHKYFLQLLVYYMALLLYMVVCLSRVLLSAHTVGPPLTQH